jgi:hypothetical protein
MYGVANGPTGVASLVKIYTDDGFFTSSDACLSCLDTSEVTNPSLEEVNSWLTDISHSMDVALDGQGFVTPITAPEKAVRMITTIVQQYVADLVKYANDTGRFRSEAAQRFGIEPMIQLSKDINNWANTNAGALEAAGAARTDAQPGTTIGTKENYPIFQRNAFGNKFDNWNND